MRFSHFTRILILGAVLSSTTVAADTLQGRVIGIADGDTVTILDASNTQHKIRLMGIDSPEKKQAFGQKAKEHLSDLIFDKQVQVEYKKKDKYGRIIGQILVGRVDANLEQVKAGMAWHYKKYALEQLVDDRVLYAQAEVRARSSHLGLWSDTNPIPPWDWRKFQRAKH